MDQGGVENILGATTGAADEPVAGVSLDLEGRDEGGALAVFAFKHCGRGFLPDGSGLTDCIVTCGDEKGIGLELWQIH